jgi:hypothetical protein
VCKEVPVTRDRFEVKIKCKCKEKKKSRGVCRKVHREECRMVPSGGGGDQKNCANGRVCKGTRSGIIMTLY